MQEQSSSQPAPEHAGADGFKLPIHGFTGTPEEIEQQWFDQVYRGRGDTMKQLTLRALVMGSCLGAILSLTNLYIVLKAGWLMGVTITACILSYSLWNLLLKLGIARTPMTILENNCMQSAASAAGYSTGGTLGSAFAAYIMLNGHSLPVGLMMAWVFLIAVLGVTMAIPMKKQMINIDQLRFPTGTATAETLRALHAHQGSGARAARALGIAGIIAAIDNFWHDGFDLFTGKLAFLAGYSSDALITVFNKHVIGPVWMGRTVIVSWEPIFIASGAIMGMRVCLSILIGSILCWMVYIPALQHAGLITGGGYRDCVQWSLWFGVPCMVTSSLLNFAMQWRTALRAFQGLTAMFSRNKKVSPCDAIEAPMSWFAAGQLFSLIGLALLAHATFGMPYWQSTVAVLMSFALALVACRITGETDTTPMGALGKVTQLTFGVLSPGNINVNLMSANISAGAVASSADLLTDLKSGYLLGANPRKQFLAQFSGIFIGTIMSVLAFSVLVSNPAVIGSEQFPAPSAQTWAAVAKALSKGLEALEPAKVTSIIAGGILGLVLELLVVLFPKKRKYLLSVSGFGLAWIFQWYYGVLFFIGALLAWLYEKKRPKSAEEFTLPVASGIIAGGALMGVIIVFIQNGPEMVHKFLSH